jgi:hypothetical protein
MTNETIAKRGSGNTTTLDAPPDRMSHNELLKRLNRSDSLASLRADQEHEVLRNLMIEKHGEVRVLEVEAEITKEKQYEYRK